MPEKQTAQNILLWFTGIVGIAIVLCLFLSVRNAGNSVSTPALTRTITLSSISPSLPTVNPLLSNSVLFFNSVPETIGQWKLDKPNSYVVRQYPGGAVLFYNLPEQGDLQVTYWVMRDSEHDTGLNKAHDRFRLEASLIQVPKISVNIGDQAIISPTNRKPQNKNGANPTVLAMMQWQTIFIDVYATPGLLNSNFEFTEAEATEFLQKLFEAVPKPADILTPSKNLTSTALFTPPTLTRIITISGPDTGRTIAPPSGPTVAPIPQNSQDFFDAMPETIGRWKLVKDKTYVVKQYPGGVALTYTVPDLGDIQILYWLIYNSQIPEYNTNNAIDRFRLETALITSHKILVDVGDQAIISPTNRKPMEKTGANPTVLAILQWRNIVIDIYATPDLLKSDFEFTDAEAVEFLTTAFAAIPKPEGTSTPVP